MRKRNWLFYTADIIVIRKRIHFSSFFREKNVKNKKISNLTAFGGGIIIGIIYFAESATGNARGGAKVEIVVLAALWQEMPSVSEAAFSALLPPERLARLHGRRGEKEVQVLAAYGLLHRGMAKFGGQGPLPPLHYGSCGKPAFPEGYPCFSLSHTEGMALCAFSEQPVGVDGERLRPVDTARAKRLNLPVGSAAFFEEWTARESRMKRRGGSAAACRRPVEPEPGEWVRTLPVAPGYAAALCSGAEAAVRLERMDLRTVLAPWMDLRAGEETEGERSGQPVAALNGFSG